MHAHMHTNDLPDCITSSCGLLADDCLLYKKIETIHNSDHGTLQQDVYNVEMWARKCLMTYSTLSFLRRNPYHCQQKVK